MHLRVGVPAPGQRQAQHREDHCRRPGTPHDSHSLAELVGPGRDGQARRPRHRRDTGGRIRPTSRRLQLYDADLCNNMRVCADNQQPMEQPPADQIDLVVEVFRMLADPTRVRLLWAMLDDELSVAELAAAVGKPPSGVSQHLAKLRMARLVRTRRHGTQVFYRVENAHIRQLVADAVYHADHAGTGVPDHHRGDPDLRNLPTDAGGDAPALTGRVAGAESRPHGRDRDDHGRRAGGA
jgi:DNA-binding transcriptional ArsR family regulator